MGRRITKLVLVLAILASEYLSVMIILYEFTSCVILSVLAVLSLVIASIVHESMHYIASIKRVKGFGISAMGPFVIVNYSKKAIAAPALEAALQLLLSVIMILLSPFHTLLVVSIIVVLFLSAIFSLLGSVVDLIFLVVPRRIAHKIEEKAILSLAVFLDLENRKIIEGKEILEISRALD